MSCYLCRFGRSDRPLTYDPAPTLLLSIEVGTCHKCHVHACDRHGTRYSREFVCAICRPALALGSGSGHPPDAATVDELNEHAPAMFAMALAISQALITTRMTTVLDTVRTEAETAAADGFETSRMNGLAASIYQAAFVRQQAEPFSSGIPDDLQLGLLARRQQRGVEHLVEEWRDNEIALTGDPDVAVAALAHLYAALGGRDPNAVIADTTDDPAATFPNPWAIPGAQALPPIGWLIGIAYFEGWGTGESSPLDPVTRPNLPSGPAGPTVPVQITVHEPLRAHP